MKTIVTIALSLLTGLPVSAESIWTSCGLGAGSHGMAAAANVSMQFGRHGLISLRFFHTGDFDRVNAGFFEGPSFYEGAYDIGLLAGLVHHDPRQKTSFSASLGVGMTSITRKGELVDNWLFPDYWDKEEYSTTGLLFQSQMFIKKFGFQVFANHNSVESFTGVVVSYRFVRSH